MTALIHSKVPSLSHLRIQPMPAKPLKGATVLRIPASGTCVAIGPNGTLYSTQVIGGSKNHRNLDHGRIRCTIDGLIKLGALSTAAVEEHQEGIRLAEERGMRASAADGLLDDAKELGIKLTKTQIRAIDKALGGDAKARAKIAEKLGAEAVNGI